MEQSLESLTLVEVLWLCGLGALHTAGFWYLHRGVVRALRFRRPPAAQEPALWGASGGVVCLLVWLGLQFLFGGALLVVSRSVPTAPEAPAVVDSPEEAGAARRDRAVARGAPFVEGLASLCANLFAVIFLLRFLQPLYGGRPDSLGLRPTSWRNVLPTLIAYPLFWFAVIPWALAWRFFLERVLGREPELQIAVQLFLDALEGESALTAALLLLLGIVVAPVTEELMFRGALFGGLRQSYGVWPAAVVSSLVFALLHFSADNLLSLFFLSLLLSYLYVRTASLYIPILFHMFFNACSFALLFAQGRT